MHKITIVGMGPGDETYLTRQAYNILTTGEHVYLRTDQHPVVEQLIEAGMTYHSFDALYETYETFDEVYEAISEQIITLSEKQPVIYAVPGNPFVAEKSVSLILEKATAPIEVVHGTSFIDAIVTTLRYDPVKGMVILDALNIDNEKVNAAKDHLFIQVYDQMTASLLKLKLMTFWDDLHEVTIIKAAGIPQQEVVVRKKLYELDHDATLFNHLTSVFVPGGVPIKHDISELVEIMKTLRSEEGCPWDREQTHESLAPYLIEEAYEVKDAIIQNSDEALIEELGDVLLQIVFHAAIAEEDGYFELSDIIEVICEKMIRRHPHVFGDVVAKTSEEVLTNWQAIKNNEKEHKRIHQSMASVTYSLPSLIRAQKVQKKAADVGFDWASPDHAFEKIEEEVLEWKEAIQKGEPEAIREELGDLLLIISNVSRLLGLDAEQALMDATEKFVKRFKYIEENLEKNGLSPNALILERMEELWQASKKIVKL